MNKIGTFVITIILLTISGTRLLGQVTELGVASFYDDKFEGRVTASGQTFSQSKLTAAHRTLPFGSVVKVINLVNNLSVEVTINDRGPFVSDRIIDLSKSAAKKIGFIGDGTIRVKLEVVSIPDANDQKTEKKELTQSVQKEKVEIKKEEKQQEIYEGINPEYYKIQSQSIDPKGFGIQVASYQEAANLVKRCAEISTQISKDVIIQVAGNSDAKVYRIIIGPFETREEAENFNQKLNDFKGSFVIRLDK
jgi:rare lipoprotein A